MIVGLDTSVVLRLLVGQPADQAARARKQLERAHAAGDDVIVSDLVLAEAYYALHYHYRLSKVDARDLLKRMMTSGVVRMDPEGSLIALDRSDGAGFVDRLILHRYRAINATTATFDRKLGAAGASKW